jgi:hypothetical protein
VDRRQLLRRIERAWRDFQDCQVLASAANEHGQVVMSVGGSGDTTNGAKYAEGDFAVCNQFRDVGQ